MQFVLGYTPDEFAATLGHIAEGAIPVAPLLTGRVGLGGVARAFEDLAAPDRHAKILVEPGAQLSAARYRSRSARRYCRQWARAARGGGAWPARRSAPRHAVGRRAARRSGRRDSERTRATSRASASGSPDGSAGRGPRVARQTRKSRRLAMISRRRCRPSTGARARNAAGTGSARSTARTRSVAQIPRGARPAPIHEASRSQSMLGAARQHPEQVPARSSVRARTSPGPCGPRREARCLPRSACEVVPRHRAAQPEPASPAPAGPRRARRAACGSPRAGPGR